MKKILLSVCLVIAGCFCLVSSGYAGSPDLGHSFKIGMEYGYHEYQESGVMEETGMLQGLIGSYTYHNDKGLMANASLRLGYGELEYDGRTWGGTPLQMDTENGILELRGLVGYDHKLKDDCFITPFIGIGYRYLNNDTNYAGGYEREIEYLYVPIGISTDSSLNNEWRWGVNMEYDLFLAGHVVSYLSDVYPAYNNLENDQDFMDGYGARFSLHFKKEISDNVSLSIEPFMRYWEIKDSNVSILTVYGTPVAYGYEPQNDTTTYGLRISFIL